MYGRHDYLQGPQVFCSIFRFYDPKNQRLKELNIFANKIRVLCCRSVERSRKVFPPWHSESNTWAHETYWLSDIADFLVDVTVDRRWSDFEPEWLITGRDNTSLPSLVYHILMLRTSDRQGMRCADQVRGPDLAPNHILARIRVVTVSSLIACFKKWFRVTHYRESDDTSFTFTA